MEMASVVFCTQAEIQPVNLVFVCKNKAEKGCNHCKKASFCYFDNYIVAEVATRAGKCYTQQRALLPCKDLCHPCEL